MPSSGGRSMLVVLPALLHHLIIAGVHWHQREEREEGRLADR
jgi:hypothetical protein